MAQVAEQVTLVHDGTDALLVDDSEIAEEGLLALVHFFDGELLLGFARLCAPNAAKAASADNELELVVRFGGY